VTRSALEVMNDGGQPGDVDLVQASVLSHDGSDTLTRSVAKATATDIYGNVLNSAGF
jgi:hypothetical protein